MRRYIQTHVEDALAEKIIADYNRTITHARVDVKDGELIVTAL
jgi:ATP-dependent Clp protease ATP-binding subunit ClpA